MSENDPRPAFHVPAPEIPVPTSISPQAQAVLAKGLIGGRPQPPLSELDADIRQFIDHHLND
ncbi:hypothetical protein [Pseudofrankia inefficax]|uniref:Uncharacterized protein n=1 Tax=Pseudofrankia inefficax (strain DSM 45817 / CECT 9037 / DDB 130130 / EuI1c) TaxID=298654 RepID=E3J3N1_PSEI1|nr:hypothetical protein [Pseudofrankia inefficax]ADP79368.1 hypothetical protein FraEuI1c_1299 [Pseudofrankia inefficax]